ncbi:DMT family transporter [Pseudoroseomonas cervicalis]|uniref:DMT family transporter n=1 Tax=Teichococcus cervicalis TaxID=204525 RepID=UPI0022F15051|nr:DMT family transporter [Pseudoroseomonas cervicalis]WBV44321.1 DMT family transporter [Pseudoroseomonas cervicalis]
MPHFSQRARGMAMLTGTALVWGGMFAVVKPLMAGFDPFTLTLLRYGITAPLLLLLLWVVEGRAALRLEGAALRLWLLGTLGFAGFGLLAFLGLALAEPQHASVIPALMPLIAVAVTAGRTRRRPAPRALAAVGLGLAGVALVVSGGAPALLLSGGVGQGEGLVFLGAFAWVLYTLGAQRFPGWSGLRFTALSCALGTLSILGLEGLALALGWAHWPSAASLAAATPSLLYLTLLASLLGVLGWNGGMRAVGPARGVLFINLVPVTAFAIAVVGGQVPAAGEIAGVALVIAALLLNSLGAAPAAPRPAALAPAGKRPCPQ